MARTIWNGTIGFGLLNVPVGLYTAVREQDVSMRQLCPEHRKPITTARLCTEDGAAIEYADLVKGFEHAPGEFVVLTEDDLARAALPLSRHFDIRLCVPEAEVDLRYFHTAYFVVPKPEGARTYSLLRDAIRRTGKVAIGKIALKTKQQVAALRVLGSALVLHLMHWPDELVAASDLAFPDLVTDPEEVALAEELMERFAGSLGTDTWTDDYRENLQRIIEARIRGEDVAFAPGPDRSPTAVVDLVAMLRASLDTRQAA